jgi:hypothetical protein
MESSAGEGKRRCNCFVRAIAEGSDLIGVGDGGGEGGSA